MATRSNASLTVVSSPATQPGCCARSRCSDQAESLPVDQLTAIRTPRSCHVQRATCNGATCGAMCQVRGATCQALVRRVALHAARRTSTWHVALSTSHRTSHGALLNVARDLTLLIGTRAHPVRFRVVCAVSFRRRGPYSPRVDPRGTGTIDRR